MYQHMQLTTHAQKVSHVVPKNVGESLLYVYILLPTMRSVNKNTIFKLLGETFGLRDRLVSRIVSIAFHRLQKRTIPCYCEK